MTTQFFSSCTSKDEVKVQYRKLAKENHPDHGGDTATMQAINKEYALLCDYFTRNDKPDWTADQYATQSQVDERLREVIEKLVTLPGIEIEICGLWVWVSGDTKPVKEQLKEYGLRWAHKKEKWYYAGVATSSHGKYSMTEIRNRYGSTKVEKEERTMVA